MVWTFIHAAAHGAYCACFSSGRGLRDPGPEAGTYQKKCPPHPRCHFFGLQSLFWGGAAALTQLKASHNHFTCLVYAPT